MKLPRSFSLLTFLMLATIAAIAVALYQANIKVAQTGADFLRYSNEMGFIAVPEEEESKLHFRRLAGYPLLSFGFRYHIPKDKQFTVHIGSGVADPDTGLPPVIFSTSLTNNTEQGTLVVNLAKMPTPYGKCWVVDTIVDRNLSRDFCKNPHEFTWLQTYLSAFPDGQSTAAPYSFRPELFNAPIGGHGAISVYDEEDFVSLYRQKEFHSSAVPSIPQEMLEQRKIFQIWLTQTKEKGPRKR